MEIPNEVLPEIRLPWFAAEPPIEILLALESINIPSPPLAISVIPAKFVPIWLP